MIKIILFLHLANESELCATRNSSNLKVVTRTLGAWIRLPRRSNVQPEMTLTDSGHSWDWGLVTRALSAAKGGARMIRKTRLISASHVELSAGSDTRRVEKTSIFNRRYALLTAASVLALSAVGPLEATAQTVSEIAASANIGTITQTGPSPNVGLNGFAIFLSTDTTDTPLVVFESADARSIAQSTITLDIDVSQTNTDTAVGALNQQNTYTTNTDFDAIASSGLVDITNTAITGSTFALSQATSAISADIDIDQANSNAGVSNAANTAQATNQQNSSTANADYDAVASSGPVNVSSSGDINEPTLAGVSAASVATATAEIAVDLTQSNSNSLTGSTSGANQPLTQSQATTQANLNTESLSLNSAAQSGSVAVLRDGSTVAALDGIAASSVATASAAIESAVSQSNSNSLSATTTGGGSSPITQTQSANQSNGNSEALSAASAAQSGNVSATNSGDIDAGGAGINAAAAASSSAQIASTLNQSNSNSASATTTNGAVTQTQSPIQNNGNKQNMSAASAAQSGAVAVASDGDITAVDEGINAATAASSDAGIASAVNQGNSNSGSASAGAGATARSATQTQSPIQNNSNGQGLAASSAAQSGVVAVSSDAYSGAGINAASAASSNAGITAAVSQGNTNSGSASTTNGNATQTQSPVQTNSNSLSAAAASAAQSGDVAVTSEGDTGDGINASTAASSTAGITGTVSQGNSNSGSTSTAGNNRTATQTQSPIQTNQNSESLAAASAAQSGDVAVTSEAYSGADINAASAASSNAGITSTVSQGNSNSGSVSTANGDAVQTQSPSQTSGNSQSLDAASAAQSGDVAVASEGDVGANINAASAASSNAGITSTVSQGNSNSGSASAAGNGRPATQNQTQRQTNSNGQEIEASSQAQSGDIAVAADGDAGAGINAATAASSNAGITSTVSQGNSNSGSATTSGNSSAVAQTQSPIQTNSNGQELEASSAAQSGDVAVSSETYSGAGINAATAASSNAGITSTVSQGNSNSGNASTAGTTSPIVQIQTPIQTNTNEQEIFVASQAQSGDVAVVKDGDDAGISAATAASSNAGITSTVSQGNSNSGSASSTGNGSPITQNQLATQTNVNEQELISISGAQSGGVSVAVEGDIDSSGAGINAASTASANSGTTSTVSQGNSNSGSATTAGDGSFIAQAPVGLSLAGNVTIGQFVIPFAGSLSFPGGQAALQQNVNEQLIVNLAEASSGDIFVSDEGYTTAVGNGIDAVSSASAGSAVTSNVSQSNSNSLSASTEGDLGAVSIPIAVDLPGGLPVVNVDIPVPVPAFVAQGQAARQLNANEQILVAASEAEAGDVFVAREGDTYADGIGINAVSSAVADASVTNNVTQSNSNSASATSTGDGAFIAQTPVELSVPFNTSISLPIVGTVALAGTLDTSFGGGQAVTQQNVNAQLIIAGSGAEAGDVSVSSDGYTSVDGIGINAVSSASAGASIENGVTQSNNNSLTASTSGDLGLIGQAQEAEQVNENLQLLASIAEANSGNVAVESKGDMDAGGSGIVAVSSAVAGANLNSSVNQSNTNGASATTAGDLTAIAQTQEVEQANINLQGAAAIAVANSGSVTVDQRGSIASGGDGITAVSSATSGANLNQSAVQSNTNNASATLTAPSAGAAIQTQLAEQVNLNVQGGASIATATSDFVEVRSTEDPSQGNGITATSSAVAGANLSQSATQNNLNTVSTTLPALGVADEPVLLPLQLAVQLDGIVQANANLQGGAAIAVASSDYVTVEQGGALSAGLDGVTATSSAVAGANLNQSVAQNNSNNGSISRAEGPAPGEGEFLVQPEAIALQLEGVLQINASGQGGLAVAVADAGSVDVNSHDDLSAKGNGITATSSAVAGANLEQIANQANTNIDAATGTGILQLQLVGQANFSEQAGAAIAAATSDYVNVDQSGYLTAGGDGITATSSAVAGAGLSQNANQFNTNSATATLEGSGFGSIAAQLQLVGQLNVNGQDGLAVADATSSYVEVRSYEDPSDGNGITATSTAVAGASLDQSTNQSNTNTAIITLPAQPVVPASSEFPVTGLEIAAQVEGVLQLNVNEQEGLAVANATSDYVLVEQSGPLSAGGNGITATSSAVAGSNLSQSANQSNADTKVISRADAPVAGEGEVVLNPQALDVQLEAVLQANVNSQSGASIAAASSGSVEVDSHDELSAGGDGITATSSAVAGANLAQSANQSNSNSVAATGGFVLQGQLAGQINDSEQEGAAIAAASSDYVDIEQTDLLKRGGDGITATSSAVAGANLSQSANQANSNSASGTLEAPDSIVPLQIGDIFIPLSQAGVQAQLAGQFNINDQDGLAIAAATSGPVDVRSFDDPATGDGITATSSAVAGANLTQSVNQANSNSANITLPPRPIIPEDREALERVEVAAQVEGVLQLNVNEQVGLATAAASSDAVTVEQNGTMSAGGNGDTATSSAVAAANLTQTANQTNSDTKTITRAEEAEPGEDEQTVHPTALNVQLEGVLQGNISEQSAASIAAASSGSVDLRSNESITAGGDAINATSSAVGVATLQQTANQNNDNSVDATGTIALQGQLLGQLNFSEQEGAAIAAASSDYVSVDQDGYLKADGSGITATSSAVAVADLAQGADQSNTNSASATLELPDNEFIVPVPTGSELELRLPVGPAAAQAQLAGQLNINDQDGAAIAAATSDYVEVRSYINRRKGYGIAGDGINATSSAVATAELTQTADQSNSNSASITQPAFEVITIDPQVPTPIRLRGWDVGLQLEGVLQANINEQEGAAVAAATSDYVKVDQSGKLATYGDGINATSSAVAVANLNQSAVQSNSDTKEVARAGGPELGADQVEFPRQTISVQLEGALQANLNSQSGEAIATAQSGSVEVRNKDTLLAYGDAINATSSAVAVANLDQSAEQSNSSSMSGIGTGIVQGQLVGQANINATFDEEEGLEAGQSGVAVAEATSDFVYVDQSGVLEAGGDGINATSSAVAASTLTQSAEQTNTNSATATLDPQRFFIIETEAALLDIEPIDLVEGNVAGQFQLAGQVNLNSQEGLVIASATSDYVDVRSAEDPSDGNGITATSSAVAGAALTQTANQANENSATITLPAPPIVPGDVLVRYRGETAEQEELVIQANINEQEGAAVASATSGPVTVDESYQTSGGDAVSATSSAVAAASLDQTVDQSNSDSKLVERATGPAPGEDETVVQPFAEVSQDEIVIQANVSDQDGAAAAEATSDSVSVRSEGELSAGGNGITATSSAVAAAVLNQSATQSNENSVSAEGTVVGGGFDVALVDFDDGGQNQFVLQANINEQEGAVVASASSGSVFVDQNGYVSAGGDGISATSSAVAVATLDQVADQTNSNDLSARIDGTENTRHIGSQDQTVLQFNVSQQAGAAIASATSDYVEVRSAQDPAGGDGINATSSAAATASLSQYANQENSNNSTVTLPNQTVATIDEIIDQSQEVEQENINEQEGAVIATATSDYVSVEQSGALSAGGDGINATSSAVAVAQLEQGVDQSNSNTQSVVREEPGEGEESVSPFTSVEQFQEVEQENESEQDGAAVASATSDSVDVGSADSVSAGGNGIAATSSATSIADIDQSATQSNSNEQSMVATQFLSGQNFNQANSSAQNAAAVAGASSDYAKVNQSGYLSAGGDGISATSAAEAQAQIGQTVDQSNSNNVNIALQVVPPAAPAPEASILSDPPLTNASTQNGAAVADATSDYVEIEQSGDLSAGGIGISATSSAIAKALIDQTANQDNDSATVLSGPEVEGGKFSLAQEAEQANENSQSGVALATATSDYVSLTKSGDLTSGPGGISAVSSAVAVAAIEQQADQSNNTSQTANLGSGGLSLTQEINQRNFSEQSGESIAIASSDYVEVNNYGDVLNTGGDGIHAESSAVAIAKVDQEANQTNTNSQTATMADAPSSVVLTQQVTPPEGPTQPGLVQSNESDQEAVAVALASSDDVKVYSEGFVDPADGIDAKSSAVAVAAIDQSATQTNSDTQTNIQNNCDENCQANLTIYSNQQNVADQDAVAAAVAVSGNVTVVQKGDVSAYADGIDATSSAVAVAKVEQDLTQSNTTIQQSTQNQAPESDVEPLAIELDPESGQGAIGIAVALADEVTVEQYGDVSAGEDGVKGVSSAVAVATVEQEGYVEQLASVAAVAIADEVNVSANGNIKAGDDGVVGVSSAVAIAEGGKSPIDLAALEERYDGQALNQLALPSDLDTLALAVADEVNVTTWGSVTAGGNGVVAVSFAKARAEGQNGAAIALSDDVNVIVNGDVRSRKTGIFAASIADADANGGFEVEEQGDVTVTVNRGRVTGGFGYYGIVVLGGDDNVITIGKGATVTSASRHAIFGGDEDETVENYGLVDGNVDLGLGDSAFNNYAGASFYTASIINLNGGQLFNGGLLSPGGPGVIQSTELNGSLLQSSTGRYAVDVDMGNANSDFIHMNGGADLNGRVLPTIVANPVTGKEQVTILTADGGVINNGVAVKDTALVDYGLELDPNNVVLKIDVDFAPKGLAKEQNGVGSVLNKVFKGGGPNDMEGLALALLQLPTVKDVSKAYTQLTGENYRALSMAELYSQERFSDDQMNCPARGDTGAYVAAPAMPEPLKLGEGDYAPGQAPMVAPSIDENQCVWTRVRWRNLQQDANSGTTGFDEDAVGISGGGQVALSGPWFAGLALGYENSQLDTNLPVVNSDGDRFRIGGSLKYINGPWFVGGAITGGWSNYDSNRHISFPGFATVTSSSQDFQNIAGQARIAYQIATQGAWYFKPLVDFNVTNVDMDSFSEKGGNGAALRVSSSDETVFSATPALEVGTQWGHAGGVITRPYVRGGVSFYSDADFPMSASFASAPGANFTTNGEIDDVLGVVSAGVSFLGVRGGVLTFSYDGAYGDTLEEHSASAKASMRF